MRLQWLGQLCPPGQYADFTGICRPVPGIPQPGQPIPITEVPAGVVITPVRAERPPDRTLLYAAAIVGAGIVTAVVLSRVAS